MRVLQGQGQQLAALFHDDAVGARRQRHDARAFSDLLDQQGAMRGAVEHTDVTGSVQRQETLAALFGGDFNNRRVAHLEAADVLEALFAIRVAGHEPLAQAAGGVTQDQRNATHQLRTGSDFSGGVFGQFVTAIQAFVAQAEHVGLSAAIDDIQPLLTRVDVQRFDLLGHLRQLDAGLGVRDLTRHHVFFTGQRQHVQLRAGRARQHQRRIVHAEVHVIQRTPLRVKRDRRLAVRVFDGRADGLFAIRVADFIRVAKHQRLAVGQAQDHHRVTRLILAQRRHMGVGGQRQVHAGEFFAALGIEEQHHALIGHAHTHLILLFDRQHQRLACVLHPHGRNRLFGIQVGALEQRQHHITEEEENQCDRAEHGKTADKYIPAGQVIFERTHAALALQFRRIEINALGSGCRSHWGIGQIIHAHTLAVLYDKKMTKQ